MKRAAANSRRGSVLVPVVAAMLLLLLSGMVLAEAFGAQRMQSVMDVHATRAFWIAEAGVWHAAHEGAGVAAPVAFGGGEYTVVHSDGVYASTGSLHEARQVVTRTLSFYSDD